MLKNRTVKNIISAIAFLIIICFIFVKLTYLFRTVNFYDREHINGIQNYDVDMAYIGGSAAYTYWQTMKAWEDCGITSYDFTTRGVAAENLKAYIEEIRRSNEPKLYVVDMRAFQYYSDWPDEAGVRNATDNMDILSPARYHLLNDYFENRTVDENTDKLSYYIDFVSNHSVISNLGSEAAWKYIYNDRLSAGRGYEGLMDYIYLERPVDFETEERTKLLDNDEKILRELLEYCRSEKLNVLFVVCPYFINSEDQMKYNTIGDIVSEYGYEFFNGNYYYDEMGIDFANDYGDRNHVNVFGAEKYTEYMEKYIQEKYSLPDHRGETEYAEWDEDYKKFVKDNDDQIQQVLDMKEMVTGTWDVLEKMKNAETLEQWYKYAKDDRYTLIVVGDRIDTWPENYLAAEVLNGWNLEENSTDFIRVCSESPRVELNSNADNGDLCLKGQLGIWLDVKYYLSLEDNDTYVEVDSKKYDVESGKINVFIFENYYRELVGQAVICDKEGKTIVEYR